MSLTISNQNKVLKYYGLLVGYKSFCVSFIDDLITLESFVVESFKYKFNLDTYAFTHTLVVEPYNQEQGIFYTVQIYPNFGKAYDFIKIERGKLGYHIYPFPKEHNIEACFNTFCVKDDMATLPVIFEPENVQMIGNHIVVDQFAIPDQDLYSEICNAYDVKPAEFLIEFLEKLFKSYSSLY
jgi:hypothetical protein